MSCPSFKINMAITKIYVASDGTTIQICFVLTLNQFFLQSHVETERCPMIHNYMILSEVVSSLNKPQPAIDRNLLNSYLYMFSSKVLILKELIKFEGSNFEYGIFVMC